METSETLRAQLAEARLRLQREVHRTEQLQREVDQAGERQELRDAIAQVESDIRGREAINTYHSDFKNDVDRDMQDRDDYERDWGETGVPERMLTVTPKSVPCNGESLDFSHTVRKGEYVWKLQGISWLASALKQQQSGRPRMHSNDFTIGSDNFDLVYSPDYHLSYDVRGSLAIRHLGNLGINFKYQILVKNAQGEFIQWGQTAHECHSEHKDFFGPDVQNANMLTNYRDMGIFGLSHKHLVESDWVQNDTLVVKAKLEVRYHDDSYHLMGLNITKLEVPPANLHASFLELLDSEKHSDVTFVIEGEHVKAHSQILSARSEFFEKELTCGMCESISKQIIIKECDIITFRALLRFLYTDDLTCIEELFKRKCVEAIATGSDATMLASSPSSHLQTLLAVSHKYQVPRLQLWSEHKLCESISVKEVCSVLRSAHLYKAKQLELTCLAFIKENMAEVAITPEFGDLAQAWPELMISINMYVGGMSENVSAQALQAFQDSRKRSPSSSEEDERSKRKRED